MQFTKIALAAAVTLVAAQAQAATVYLAGASAFQTNARAALVSLCSGTPTTIISTADTNKSAVKCSVDFTGLPGVNAVAMSVNGGSFTAVTTSVGTATETFVDVNDNSGATLTAPRSSEGGFLDIDAAAFSQADYDANGVTSVPATQATGFAQVFGVAVSPALYTALQAAQGLTGCGIDSLTPACQPTISKVAYTTIVSDAFNSAKTKGAEFLLSSLSGQKLTLCRRVSTSGTQASSNQFFLNSYIGGDGSAGGALSPATAAGYDGTVDSGTTLFQVQEGSGTANARACLSDETYAVGVLSLENAPDLTTRSGGQRADRKWRFVKINGVNAFDNTVVSGVNTNSIKTAKNGSYDFWFIAQKIGTTANGTAVVDAIDAALSAGLNVPGAFDLPSSTAKRDSNVAPVRFD
jgi:hypothetical protein